MSGGRFYVVELEGHDGEGGGTGGYTLTASVLERAYCHHEVARFTQRRAALPGHKHANTRAEHVAYVREQARALAARLNAEAGA